LGIAAPASTADQLAADELDVAELRLDACKVLLEPIDFLR
jgi:hypothetical protein